MLTYVWIVSWIQTAVGASILVAVASILGIYTSLAASTIDLEQQS